MKTSKQMNQKRTAFTLIEMVGVLAVIAILMALLVPKIFAAINESRFSNTVASVNAVKAASMSYFAAVGDFTNSSAFDAVLLKGNYLEREFACKVGATNQVRVVTAVGTTAGTTGVYDLDGEGANVPVGAMVVEIVIGPVSEADAWELSKRIDGEGKMSPKTSDTKGRVTWANSVVSIYLGHK